MKLEFQVKKPLATTFEYLTNSEKFVSVHPIIYKMEPKGDNTYLVFEKLKMLFIPVSFTYSATISGNLDERRINIRATVMKMTKIEMQFTLEEKNNGTFITEEISFNSMLPVKPVMRKIFREQHTQLFANIDKA
jgi:carbon monoxide dehydrogenase subunit G